MPLHGLTLEKLLSPGDGLALGLDGELVWSWNQIVLQHRYTGIPPGFCSDAERQKAISRWEAQYRAYRQTHDHFFYPKAILQPEQFVGREEELQDIHRHLTDLELAGVERISSSALGQSMNLTASQIRQDLSCFGEFGQQGYGYKVENLRREIADILAANEPASVYRKIEGRDYNLRFTFNKDSNVLLISDVTELMAALRTKNDFIANVTHEMNTPLTSIRGFAELIAAGGIPPERIGSVAKTIIKQSDRLANLIRSIINFSAIDSDELPDYEVDLTELVREAIGSFEPKLAQKHLALRLDVAGGVRVMSRRERLLEIFNNLVSNAIRYNKEGGELAVRLTGGETPVLSVSDTGIGLSEEDKTRIFDRFYTVDKSHNGSGGGFGLGLAIVKKLCRRAGWKLSVESELGEGTTFSIEFCKKQ